MPLSDPWTPPPNHVTLSPFTTRAHSLSLKPNRHHVQPSPLFRWNGKGPLAWLSLQGRLVGAAEATSARTIGGGLGKEEMVAWEMFRPIERVLVVAVVAAAAAQGKRIREVVRLRECVQARDETLASMQKKLDDLYDQVKTGKDQHETTQNYLISKGVKFSSVEVSGQSNCNFSCSDCWLCEQHRVQSNSSLLQVKTTLKSDTSDQILNCNTPSSCVAEQEERRLSDLSDWASASAASAVDILLNNLAIEQDIYNVKRESEEKYAAIKELSTYILAKDKVTSKRIEELEDVILRKNMIISKQRKDIAILGQKVVQLTSLQRPSFFGTNIENEQLPKMIDNLLFGMESTGTSSSDSDISPGKRKKASSANSDELVAPVPIQASNESSDTRDTSPHISQESARPVHLTSSGKRKKASAFEVEESATSQVSSSESDLSRRHLQRKRLLSARARNLPSTARPSEQNQRSQRSATTNPITGKPTITKPTTAMPRAKQLSAGTEMKNRRRAGVTQDAVQRKRWAQ